MGEIDMHQMIKHNEQRGSVLMKEAAIPPKAVSKIRCSESDNTKYQVARAGVKQRLCY